MYSSFEEYLAEATNPDIKKETDKFVAFLKQLFAKASADFNEKAKTKWDGDYYTLSKVSRGPRYTKIVVGRDGADSAYCFIDNQSGDILMPTGWNAPAKGARGTVLKPESYKHADADGAWLYKR